MADATVTVRLDDLRLLLEEAEPLLVSPATANRPVVWAIDRLGDEVLKATVRCANPVPHCRVQIDGVWKLIAVPECPWCEGTNEPLPRLFGKCSNSWHRSHPEHDRHWTHPKVVWGPTVDPERRP